MKIAVTYENGSIFAHFGKSEAFKIYEVENDEIVSAEVVKTTGSGHGALAGFLSANNVDAVICGGIGQGAQTALSNAGIKLYAGISGNTDDAVKALLNGTLKLPPFILCNCSHHHHDGDHKCGEHGCGHHD